MRKLHRPQPGPDCLKRYHYQSHKWSGRVPEKSCKEDIWTEIQSMQNGFCVYCESVAIKGKGHIEHFFHKGSHSESESLYQHLTFDWDNLFGSCNATNHCGHYKDGKHGPGEYDPQNILKPDIDDPQDYFNFLLSGDIEAKPDLSEPDMKKANETIRVFNLNALKGQRNRQISLIIKELDELYHIKDELTEEQFQEQINLIKNSVVQREFQTAVLQSIF